MRKKSLLSLALIVALLLSLAPTRVTNAASATPHPITLVSRGTTTFKDVPGAAQESLGNMPNTLKSKVGNSGSLEHAVPRRQNPSALSVPVVRSSKVTTEQASGFAGWKGITHYDQRLANNGNQWSLEPPDQALCAGAGFVLEAVNDAFTIYNLQGSVQKGVTDLNTFYNYPAAIDRTNVIYGPLLTDPKCMYDVSIGRWFMSVLTLEQDPLSGAFTGSTHVDIAISKTQNPTGEWSVYAFNTTNGDGSLPGHPGCPCLGDQPLIGFNQDAFIVTTNEFAISGTNFNGAQVYAFSIPSLLKGHNVSGVYFDQLTLAEGPAYTLQPAFPNTPAALNKLPVGTEYFLSALQFTGILDNRIALWALTGTDTLDSPKPSLSLNYTVLTSEVYGMPPPASQKAGPIPLGSSLGAQENWIETNDDRMNQVQFNGDNLYAGLNTIVNVNSKERAGIAYFVVSPRVSSGVPAGTITSQGYVAVADNNVMFPSIAVAENGRALIAFSLSGSNYFPSAAYAELGDRPAVHIAGEGTEPADGMTGYAGLGGNGTERWGDYTAAVSDGSTLWMAAEYIPGGPRTQLTNWGTFVFRAAP